MFARKQDHLVATKCALRTSLKHQTDSRAPKVVPQLSLLEFKFHLVFLSGNPLSEETEAFSRCKRSLPFMYFPSLRFQQHSHGRRQKKKTFSFEHHIPNPSPLLSNQSCNKADQTSNDKVVPQSTLTMACDCRPYSSTQVT